MAEADRDRYPGCAGVSVLAGGPGSLAVAFDLFLRTPVWRRKRRTTLLWLKEAGWPGNAFGCVPSEPVRRQPLVGIWEGSGVVPPPRGDWEHWLTVNCTWLGQHGFDLRGCISVYGNEDMEFVAVNDPEARLPRSVKEGLALFAEKSKSLPPRVGVEVHGGKSFQRWRAELDEKAGSDAWGQYESAFRASCPLLNRSLKDVDVVLGGWHINWHQARPLWKHTPDNFTGLSAHDSPGWGVVTGALSVRTPSGCCGPECGSRTALRARVALTSSCRAAGDRPNQPLQQVRGHEVIPRFLSP